MAAKPREKFDAAVKVIQSLPKNGSFQPSNELMLKFYGYYKQATLGPCNTSKPAFYDIVGKAKWDAWNKLGRMPAEEAMLNYVDELKNVIDNVVHTRLVKAYILALINFSARRLQNPPIMKLQFGWRIDKERIVEAMPHTTMVAEFVEKLGNFYELVDDKTLKNGPGATSATSKVPVSNGNTPRENGMKPHTNGDSDPSVESTPQHSVSDESSESLPVSPDSSPVRSGASVVPASSTNEVILTSIPVKASPPTPRGDDSPPPPAIHPPTQNGHSIGNGDRQYADSDGMSDSEGEEFCDTSDLPDDQLISVSRSSTPDTDSHSRIVTTATVHHQVDSASPSITSDRHAHPGDRQPISDLVTCRGGGDSSSDRQTTGMSRTGSGSSLSNTNRGTSPRDAVPPPHRSALLLAGGSGGAAGGGGRDPRSPPTEVSEQIAVALVRLQQDMNSVLARLNTLEALSVAQTQMHRSRTSSESERSLRPSRPWWWPFPALDARSVFFILAWPLIVHWVLTLLARRRHRRR